MDNEIKNHTPDEVMAQILANQKLLLLTAIKFVTPQCAKLDNNRSWLDLNLSLIDEYHRTRVLIGEEDNNKFFKNKRGHWGV